jgi:hypothetical protein
MRFEKDDKKCVLEVPDRPTVRQQMIYMGKASGLADGTYPLRFWEGAKTLILLWECEAFPDYTVDLDSVSDPTVSDILIWAGLRVWEHMANLEDLPKN